MALTPPYERNSRMVWAVFGVIAVVGIVGPIGLAMLLTVSIMLLVRHRSRAMCALTDNGGIYAETFAIWMLLIVGLSCTVALLPIGREFRFAIDGGIMLASLAALAWPTLRGVAWRQVRDDVGLNVGRRPWREPLAGVGCYATSLPLMAVGALMLFALLIFGRVIRGDGGVPGLPPSNVPNNPLLGRMPLNGWWEQIQFLLLVCVVAPVVEEIMFRGVLHRHLRDATSRLGYVGSVLVSTTVTSFEFAAIHPYGWRGVPVLMAMAFAFTLFREWRGTLAPAMIGHGLHNGMATWFLRTFM